MDLVERCYKATTNFPQSELSGLASQLRRAPISIPSNVAEGYCLKSTASYSNHVAIALGSHGELETCIKISSRLGFLTDDQKRSLSPFCEWTGRLLNGLHRSLEAKIARGRTSSS